MTENYRFVMNLSASIKTDLLLGTIDVGREGRLQRGDPRPEWRAETSRSIASCISCRSANMFPGETRCRSSAQSWATRCREILRRGKEPVVFRLTTDRVMVAPLICFEDTLGELTRQFVLRGANLLANVTNDGWFLRSAGSDATSGECDFPLRRNSPADGACRQHRRDLFRQSLWPGHADVARRQRQPVHRRRADRDGGSADERRAHLLHATRRTFCEDLCRLDLALCPRPPDEFRQTQIPGSARPGRDGGFRVHSLARWKTTP